MVTRVVKLATSLMALRSISALVVTITGISGWSVRNTSLEGQSVRTFSQTKGTYRFLSLLDLYQLINPASLMLEAMLPDERTWSWTRKII